MPLRILFVCTHNRCRSILAEAMARQIGRDLLQVASAGAQASGQVHPKSLLHLTRRGYDLTGLRSTSWSELNDFIPDLVITVCDRAANEACPVWLQDTPQVHWGLPDPSAIEDDPAQDDAFEAVMNRLEERLKAVVSRGVDARSIAEWVALFEQEGVK